MMYYNIQSKEYYVRKIKKGYNICIKGKSMKFNKDEYKEFKKAECIYA